MASAIRPSTPEMMEAMETITRKRNEIQLLEKEYQHKSEIKYFVDKKISVPSTPIIPLDELARYIEITEKKLAEKKIEYNERCLRIQEATKDALERARMSYEAQFRRADGTQ